MNPVDHLSQPDDLVTVLEAVRTEAFCTGDCATGIAVGTTSGAVVVEAVGTGTGLGATKGTTGTTGITGGAVVVVGDDALCAVSVPLGQPIAATNANIAVVEMPAVKTFEV